MDHNTWVIDGTVGCSQQNHVEAFAGRDDNNDYSLSWHSMGREEAPFYHAVRRPANTKPTFDERCSVETETYYGWFSSVERTTFRSEQSVHSNCKLSDEKKKTVDKGVQASTSRSFG